MTDTLPGSYVTMETADAFVVVSWWAPRSNERYGGLYEYEHFPTQAAAMECWREYERDEYPRARPIGIFAAKNGMPIGSRIL